MSGDEEGSQGGDSARWLDQVCLDRRLAALMGFAAATLAVASVLHLSGHVHGRSEPFDAAHAGIAEAIIGTVLACGAVAVFRRSSRARAIGIATTGFAIIGFLI